MLGTTISHYKIMEKIGQGGMGEMDPAEVQKQAVGSVREAEKREIRGGANIGRRNRGTATWIK